MAKSKTYELLVKIAGATDSSLKAACSAAAKDLDSLGAAAKKVGQVAVTALAGAATAAAGAAVSSLSTYADFEQAMDSTAITAGATEEEYAAMEAAAREMGSKTTKTATEAAEAMGYMALAGWDVQDTIDGLEPMLRLSEATNMDLATASDLVTDSMSALGLGVEDMTDYLDLAVQAQRVSNTTAEDLLEAYIGCGGAAKTAGVDMGDLSTALGVLANSGTKGAEAGTALNSMLARMTTNDAALSAFEELGVAVYDDAGNFRGLETVLTDTSQAMAGLSDEERLAAMKSIAGTNYFTEMSYLLDAVADGADGAGSAWASLEESMMDHSGVLEEVAQANTDNLAGAVEIFKSAVSELQLQLGEQLAPYAQEALEYLASEVLPTVSEKLGEIIPRVIEAGKALWDNKETILALAAGIASAVGAFQAMKTAATAVSAVKNLSSALGTVSKGGSLLSKVLSIGNIKFALIALAIGAVIAVVILLVKNWDKIKAAATAAWETIRGVWDSICGAFGDGWASIQETLSGWGAFFAGVWESIKGAFGAVASWFGGVFSGAWEAVKGAFGAVGEFFQGVWDTIVSLFTTIGTAVGDAIGGAVRSAINTVLRGAVNIINGFIGAINLAIGVINAIPGVEISTLKTLEVPQLAAGGVVTAPTILEAGEGGEPEAVLPLSKLAQLLDQRGANGTSGARQGQNDSVDTITFAPVFNFYGQTTREEAEQAGQVSFAEFKRLYQQMKAEERRKNLRAATH